MNQYLYMLSEQCEIKGFDIRELLAKIDYAWLVIDNLRAAIKNQEADNRHDKKMYYEKYI